MNLPEEREKILAGPGDFFEREKNLWELYRKSRKNQVVLKYCLCRKNGDGTLHNEKEFDSHKKAVWYLEDHANDYYYQCHQWTIQESYRVVDVRTDEEKQSDKDVIGLSK